MIKSQLKDIIFNASLRSNRTDIIFRPELLSPLISWLDFFSQISEIQHKWKSLIKGLFLKGTFQCNHKSRTVKQNQRKEFWLFSVKTLETIRRYVLTIKSCFFPLYWLPTLNWNINKTKKTWNRKFYKL